MLQLEELKPADGLLVLIKALSKNPDLILVRLELAKLLWQLDCAPFALKQLQTIEENSGLLNSAALKKLIERLGGSSKQGAAQIVNTGEQQTLASLDFDIEVLEGEK
jgi:hypothetical protein